MSFSFQPKSEEEVLNLLKAGEYAFQVKHAENAVSKKGNQMIKLIISIWDDNGREREITDYLMEAIAYKLRHFCDTVGLEDKYQAGQFDAADCVNRSGKCKIRIEESDGYPPKNAVQDYVKSDKSDQTTAQAPQEVDDDFDTSDIPF